LEKIARLIGTKPKDKKLQGLSETPGVGEKLSPRCSFSACPLCGGEEIHYAFGVAGRRLDECQACDLLFLNPQPSPEELSEIYRTGYLLGEDVPGLNERRPGLRRATAGLLLDDVRDYWGSVEPHEKSLIDIGCGSGDLLAVAESMGFHCTGVDVSHELLDKAASQLRNTQLLLGDIGSLDLPDEGYDVCVLSDALEHFRDPIRVMQSVCRILKPSGITVVATPSLESFTARFMKEKWLEFKREHLFYFRPSSLQQLLYMSGFSSIKTYPHTKVLDLEYVEAHFDRFPTASGAGKLFRRFLAFLPRFLKRRAFTTGGSGMVAIATKNRDTMNGLRKVSIILPVYNEKETFSVVVEQLIQKTIRGLEKEIIIVESNSTDGTRDDVVKLQGSPDVKIVLQRAPRGKGNAVREGLQHATGEIILIQDGDLEYDIQDYEALLRPITQLRSSFTLGIRHKGNSLKMRRFIHRPVLAWIINFGHKGLTCLFNMLYRQNLSDPFTMFKVFRKDCLRGVQLDCDHFDFDIELVIKLVRQGFTPLEIPVNYVSRSFEEGKKVSFIRDPLRICSAMFRHWFHAR